MTQDTSTPTIETYGDFQLAYMHLNLALFGGALPDVIFTLARTRHANGYIIPEGFNTTINGETVAEIGLNPETFLRRTAKEILSTIAHEMVHLHQFLNGKPSPHGYHNRQFADMMQAVGLTASDTGKPGGNPTGQNMSHYINPGEAFDRAADDLIARGWEIRYTAPEMSDDDKARKVQRKASKTKYTCPECGANAWAKPGMQLLCDDDAHAAARYMVPQP